jgi:large subunit ribosomal protein L32
LLAAAFLLEVLPVSCPRDGNDVAAAYEYPRDRNLRRRHALALGDLLHAVGEPHVALEVGAREPRVTLPKIVVLQLVRRAEAAGEEAAAERAVRDEPDAELAQRVEDLALGIASPQRILRLQRGDGMNGVRATDCLRGCLREAEVAHLAGGDELCHRTDGLLDGRLRVDTVLVVEVDVVRAEPLQRPVDRRTDVLGPSVRTTVAEGADELRGEDETVAPALDRPADELFVRAAAVELGRVEERDPELERPVDGGNRLLVVAPAVERRHAHAPEPLLGDDESLSQRPRLHHRRLYCAAPMAVPKRRQSSSRRDKRRATHAIEAPKVNVCPNCGQPKRPHHACANCGTYKGREVEPLRIDAP